jgi:hypothetical protein
MNPSLTPAERERLRQQWLQQAQAAFDLLFDDDQQPHLVSFDQREDRVASLTRELAAWLLEQHAASDPSTRPSQQTPPCCPKCGRPATRLTPPGQPLPARPLTTAAAGEILLRREQWRCRACRLAFFPSGSQAGSGHGGL